MEKSPAAVAEQATSGDRFRIAYSGTLVVYEQGSGVVVATEIGRISAMLAQGTEVAKKAAEMVLADDNFAAML